MQLEIIYEISFKKTAIEIVEKNITKHLTLK